MKITSYKFLVTNSLFLFLMCNVNAQTNPNPSTAVDAVIEAEMNTEYLPGVATVIVKDGKIVWIESYGYADVENSVPVKDSTIFLLASLSKLFTGTALMQQKDNSKFNLHDGIDQYLPWVLEIPGFESESVTFHQLMTHTSSIADNPDVMGDYYDYPDPTISLSDCMQRYFTETGADYNADLNFLPNSPGSIYEYSNMATALSGYIVEWASGYSFDQYCNENIFNRLCMNNTSWYFSDLDSAQVARPYQYDSGNFTPYAHYGFADYPNGQLRSNTLDLANFMIAYLNGGNFGGNAILSSSSIDEMWSSQIPTIDQHQGLNWYQEEIFHSGGSNWLWGHNGGESGASTDMYLDPVNNIGICVLTNGEGDGLYICDELYDYALSLNSSVLSITPECATTGIDETVAVPLKKELIKIVDFMGRETSLKTNTPLIKMYSDGSVEKVFIAE
ncbi:MAG: hypothetical protein COA32_04445 [Fluviicola sp.]|nr:MAG: hypothetical protein COA32_04445 [Fluviicola sp.]